jgi:hypothetical protein
MSVEFPLRLKDFDSKAAQRIDKWFIDASKQLNPIGVIASGVGVGSISASPSVLWSSPIKFGDIGSTPYNVRFPYMYPERCYASSNGEFVAPVSGVYDVVASLTYNPTPVFDGSDTAPRRILLGVFSTTGSTSKLHHTTVTPVAYTNSDTNNPNLTATVAGKFVFQKGDIVVIRTRPGADGPASLQWGDTFGGDDKYYSHFSCFLTHAF